MTPEKPAEGGMTEEELRSVEVDVLRDTFAGRCVAEIRRLSAALGEAREALRPFAALLTAAENHSGPIFGAPAPLSDLGSELDHATVGDLMRARALSRPEPQPPAPQPEPTPMFTESDFSFPPVLSVPNPHAPGAVEPEHAPQKAEGPIAEVDRIESSLRTREAARSRGVNVGPSDRDLRFVIDAYRAALNAQPAAACACGHSAMDHQAPGAECVVIGCACSTYAQPAAGGVTDAEIIRWLDNKLCSDEDGDFSIRFRAYVNHDADLRQVVRAAIDQEKHDAEEAADRGGD